MKEDKRPLFSLTVGEYMELNKSIRQEKQVEFNEPLTKNDDLVDIIYVQDAALITGYTRQTIYTKVSRREIPIVSGGRPLTFSRKQLNDWMANGRPSIADMIADEYLNK